MKINAQSFIWLLFAGLIGFSSCSSDEETPAPTIAITLNSLGSDQTAGVAATGATVTFNLTAEAAEGISELNATKTVGGTEDNLNGYPVTSNFNSSTKHNWNASYTVTEPSGTVILKFSVKDKKGKISSKQFSITVAPINTYQTVLLNNEFSSQQSSFYNVTENTVYNSLADAKINSAKVDFIHILRSGTSGGRKIVAPNSQDATDIYGNDAIAENVKTWATRKITKFKSLSLTQAQFDALASELNLNTAVGDATTVIDESLGSLNAQSSFGFILANGKKGVAFVTAVSGPSEFTSGGANEGSVTLTVKVQN